MRLARPFRQPDGAESPRSVGVFKLLFGGFEINTRAGTRNGTSRKVVRYKRANVRGAISEH
jgi:hypothetical protein